jgi:hypothetical protein
MFYKVYYITMKRSCVSRILATRHGVEPENSFTGYSRNQLISDERYIKNSGYVAFHYQVAKLPGYKMNFPILAIVPKMLGSVVRIMEAHFFFFLEMNIICLLDAFFTCDEDLALRARFQLAKEVRHPDLVDINDAGIGLNCTRLIEHQSLYSFLIECKSQYSCIDLNWFFIVL